MGVIMEAIKIRNVAISGRGGSKLRESGYNDAASTFERFPGEIKKKVFAR